METLLVENMYNYMIDNSLASQLYVKKFIIH